jgi:hypothetical protein
MQPFNTHTNQPIKSTMSEENEVPVGFGGRSRKRKSTNTLSGMCTTRAFSTSQYYYYYRENQH